MKPMIPVYYFSCFIVYSSLLFHICAHRAAPPRYPELRTSAPIFLPRPGPGAPKFRLLPRFFCPAPAPVPRTSDFCPDFFPAPAPVPRTSDFCPDFSTSAPDFPTSAPTSAPIREVCPDEISSKPATFCRLASLHGTDCGNKPH